VAARSKTWVCGRSFAGIAGSNPAEGMDVCCDCCVVSGTGFCFGLITRPEKSYRARARVCVCACVSECDREDLKMRRLLGHEKHYWR
jgi:hypothetical protein